MLAYGVLKHTRCFRREGKETLDLNYILKELPSCEQPDIKAEKYGIGSLSDAELLAIIIRSGSNGNNVLNTARDILKECNGLNGLCDREDSRIRNIKGIGSVKALQLYAVGEIAKRISAARAYERLSFRDPDSIYSFYRNEFGMLRQEEVHILLLDTKLRLIREMTVSKGTVNSSLVSPSDVFRLALLNSAACFILMHNHPSGDPTPSKEDIVLTETIRDLGSRMQMPIIDHIVFGSHTYYSFKENSNILQ